MGKAHRQKGSERRNRRVLRSSGGDAWLIILKMRWVIKNHPKHLDSKKGILATPVGDPGKPGESQKYWKRLRNKEFGPMDKMDCNG
jgi:hypothetical protein